MYLTSFYQNYSAIASNEETYSRSPRQQIDEAISNIIANGSFDCAECSVIDCVWTIEQAAEYLVSKAIGFIDLHSQELLRQDLYNIIKMNINC